MEQMDVKTAFLNTNLSEDIYMNSPEGSDAGSKFVKLQRSLYGLKQAPHDWFKTIDQFLVANQGYSRVKATTCLYFKRTDSDRFSLVGVYVDDLPIIGHPEM
ncbi:hypothetical protein BVRB_028310, partial [Beta vulgaris subsp. vulgaris]